MTDIATDPASNITDTTVTLNGTLSNLSDSGVIAGFQYRQTGDSTWTETSTQALNSNQSFSEGLTGLAEGTQYDFRAFGDIVNIPVTTNSVSNTDDTSATFNATLDSISGVDSVDVWFEWGQTGNGFPNSTATQTLTSPQSFSQFVSGLSASTEYQYRAHAQASSITAQGTSTTFTTDAASAFTTTETWEAYSDGDSIDGIAEWSGGVPYTVDATTNLEASLAAGYVAQEPWHEEAISLSDGGATNQTATYNAYPTPNCTIRFAYRSVGTFQGRGGFIFCVPTGQSSIVDNAYVWRTDPDTSDTRIRTRSAGTESTELNFGSALTNDTTYDVAIEVEDTGSAVAFDCTIYEWDGSSWSEWQTAQTGQDDGYNYPTDSGIGLSGIAGDNSASSGFRIDNIRFADSLNNSGTPGWTP